MREPLTVAVAQPPCRSYDVATNAAAHAAAVRDAGARVVVFPEMSVTGYEFDAEPVATDDPRLAPIVAACAETGSLALVGAPVAGEQGLPNIGTLAVDGRGAAVAYRKIYLHGAEAQWFAPGRAPTVITVDGWRLGLAICKDTGVPQHAADTAALGIDAYVAGVLDPAENGDVQQERAKRVTTEHGVWVVVSSHAGPGGAGFGPAIGRSRIWHPDGEVVAGAGAEPGEVVRAILTTTS